MFCVHPPQTHQGPGAGTLEVLLTGETQATLSAGLVYTSGPVLEEPKDQTMEDLFSEVYQLLGTGPDCLILKVGLCTWGGLNLQHRGSGLIPQTTCRHSRARCPLTPTFLRTQNYIYCISFWMKLLNY